MRILSLGCPIPNPLVDNYDWASAPAFYDYDAVIVDPGIAVSQLVLGIVDNGTAYTTHNDEPVLDGPTTDTSVGLADLLRQRRAEMQRFLAGGGLVVCMAYPDVPHPRVAGFTGCHRYYWLPAPPDRDYGPKYLLPAAGRHVSPSDYEHPFADYLDTMRDNVRYRATLAEGAEGLSETLKVIGRSPGGAAIAAEIETGGGRLIFLPALPGNLTHSERSRIGENLIDAIRDTLLTDAEEGPPDWLEEFKLPGLVEAQRRLEQAEDRFDEAEQELTEARNEYLSAERYRRLLWQEGKYGLDLPVRDALELLGFRNAASVDEPAYFLYSGDPLLVEIEGSAGPVGMNPHYRLRERIEHRIAAGTNRGQGLIIVNGQRELPPAERTEQFEDALRVASESMRYCVLRATDLFDAVRQQIEGDFDKAAFCRQIMETEGVLTLESKPETEASPASPQQAQPLGERDE